MLTKIDLKAMGMLLVWGLFAAAAPAHSSEKVVIGATQTGILVWIADARGLFEEEGLDVEVRKYQSGSFAADSVISGEVNLSTTSDSAFVSRSMNHADLRIVATMSASETARLVGRRDHGVITPGDLVGKRIGVTRTSTGD